jgi:hypothetical protein
VLDKKVTRRSLLKSMAVGTGGFIAGTVLSNCSFGGEFAPTAAVPTQLRLSR